MVCTECQRSKVKCVDPEPGQQCARCRRKNMECTPYVTRWKRRRVEGYDTARVDTQPLSNAAAKEDTDKFLATSEDAALTTQVTLEVPLSGRPSHYGLLYLVRSWFSFAFTRRSMSLLSRAGIMAQRCGISMDRLMVETGAQRGMDFLYPILLQPKEKQEATGRRLQYSELPNRLLQATTCSKERDVSQRWIWIREMYKGMSRYFCSEAFDREIKSWGKIQETFQVNTHAVVNLFVQDCSKHTRAFAHQISLHTNASTPPRPSRSSNVKILKANGSSETVDQVACLEIVDLDHAFYFIEYVPTLEEEKGSAETAGVVKLAPKNFEWEEADLLNLSDEDDADVEFILDLLK